MKRFLLNLWTDDAFFERCIATLLLIGGEMVRSGAIPTGVDGLGQKLGPFINAAAMYIAAGRTTAKT